MELPALAPTLTVSHLLKQYTQALPVLMELHTGCVGCSMNPFCTLEEMCEKYDLDVQMIIMKLKERQDQNESN